MFSGYYPRVYDSWTPPLFSLPRWFSVNAYPTLTDRLEYPPIIDYQILGTYTSPSSSMVPASWYLTPTVATSGSNLQRIFEALVNEQEFLKQAAYSTTLALGFSYDSSDILFGWECSVPDVIETVEVVLSSGQVIPIDRAVSPQDLFYSYKWNWHLIDKNRILITGLDLQPSATHKRDSSDWLWLRKEAGYDPFSHIYLEHPYTKNWYPVHPSEVRSDGMVGYNSPVVMNSRTRYPQAGKELTEVQLRVNGETVYGQQVSLWNSVDELGLWYGLYRRNRELNTVFGDVFDQLPKFTEGSTSEALTNYLSIALRQYLVSTYSPTVTGFSIPATYSDFSIAKYKQFYYFSDYLIPDTSNRFYYRERAVNPVFSQYWLDNQILTPTVVATGGLLTFTPQVDNRFQRVGSTHFSQLWTQPSTGVVLFTKAFPNEVPDVEVLFVKNVKVVDPAPATVRRRAFINNSPQLKWQSFLERTNSELKDFITGTAVFE